MKYDLYSMLTGLGDNVGNAVDQYRQRRMLSDLGGDIGGGNYTAAAKKALASGNVNMGLSLLNLGQQQQLLTQQKEADTRALDGVGGMPVTNAGGGGNPGSGPYNFQKSYALLKSQGASDDEARNLAAIFQAEASGNPNAHNGKAPDDSYGLGQINMYGNLGPQRMKQFGLSSPNDLYNPETNAKVALQIARGGGGLGNWSTYSSGAYKRFLPDQNVQVADASGAIPASAQPATQDRSSTLEKRRADLERRLMTPNISPATRTALESAIRGVDREIDRETRSQDRAQSRQDMLDNRNFQREQLQLKRDEVNAGKISPYDKKLQEERAKNTAEMEQAKATSGRTAEMMLPHIQRAEEAYRRLGDMKAIGPISSSGPSRMLGGVMGSDAEAMRQEYEAASKELELAKAQISMKGQGAITESERKILGLTLPRLDAARPETGMKTLKAWKDASVKAAIEGIPGVKPEIVSQALDAINRGADPMMVLNRAAGRDAVQQ